MSSAAEVAIKDQCHGAQRISPSIEGGRNNRALTFVIKGIWNR